MTDEQRWTDAFARKSESFTTRCPLLERPVHRCPSGGDYIELRVDDKRYRIAGTVSGTSQLAAHSKSRLESWLQHEWASGNQCPLITASAIRVLTATPSPGPTTATLEVAIEVSGANNYDVTINDAPVAFNGNTGVAHVRANGWHTLAWVVGGTPGAQYSLALSATNGLLTIDTNPISNPIDKSGRSTGNIPFVVA